MNDPLTLLLLALEVVAAGFAVGLWRGPERTLAKVLWTVILLVPAVGLVIYAAWHDPPPPSGPTDRPLERDWDQPPS